MQAERFIDYIERQGVVGYHEAYKMIHIYFPDFRDFEGILEGAVRSGQVTLLNTAEGVMLAATRKQPPKPEPPAPAPPITPTTIL